MGTRSDLHPHGRCYSGFSWLLSSGRYSAREKTCWAQQQVRVVYCSRRESEKPQCHGRSARRLSGLPSSDWLQGASQVWNRESGLASSGSTFQESWSTSPVPFASEGELSGNIHNFAAMARIQRRTLRSQALSCKRSRLHKLVVHMVCGRSSSLTDISGLFFHVQAFVCL